MSAMKMLDLAIGLSFLYLLLSVLGSGIIEVIAWVQGLRATTLQDGIKRLLADPNLEALAHKVYDHPLVKSLKPPTLNLSCLGFLSPTKGPEKLPSYIHKDTFAAVLIDAVRANATAMPTLADLRAGVANLANASPPSAIANLPGVADVQKALNTLLDEGVTDIEHAKKAIGDWFDKSMERLSGEYKRYSQKVMIVVAVIIAIALNADTWHVATALWTDPKLSEAVVAEAISASKQAAPVLPGATPDVNAGIKRLVQTNQQIAALNLPIGWAANEAPAEQLTQAPGTWISFVLLKLVGWIFTAAAVSLGAPFWFDALNKLVNLRSSGKPPEKSKA